MFPVENLHSLLRFADFELDVSAGELRKRGVRVKLQEQPLQILIMLLLRQGRLVTRDELRSTLWPSDTFVDFDHSLNSAVMRLREALGDSAESPRFVETVPKRGYRFTAPVITTSMDVVPVVTERPLIAVPTLAAAAAPAPAIRRSRTVIWGVAAIVAVGAVAIFAVRAWRDRSSVAQPDAIHSLVVLPVENLTGDKDQEFLADGITDELTTNLAKIRSLRVISLTSAMSYKGTRKAVPQIARELNVDAIVEGTLRRSGNRIRINTELVRVATDRTIWVETYDTELADIISTESDAAQTIAKQMRLNLTPEEKQDLQPHSMNGPAYEAYLKGRYYWNQRTDESLHRAIGYFQDAIRKDPNGALAYAGVADCYAILGSAIAEAVATKEAYPEARAAALKALQLDDSLAEAHTSLATIYFNYDWNWPAAENELKRALQINPNYATAHQRYSLYLIALGRPADSIAEMERARELDPMSASINFSLGWRLYLARRYDEAITQLRSMLANIDSNFVLAHLALGETYEEKGQFDDAILELRRAAVLSRDKPLVLGALGNALARAGRRAEAMQLLQHLQAESKSTYVSPVHIARVYAGLGDGSTAMNWLERGLVDRSNELLFLKVDPQFDAVRSDPKFQNLLKRIGLPQ